MAVKLSAQEATDALKAWAKDDVTGITSTRFEAAKFFFAASSATIGFIAAAWKALHDKAAFSGIVLTSLGILGGSTLFALYMFWPVFYYMRGEEDLQEQHREFVKRFKTEGVIWSMLWVFGVILGLVGTFG